VHCPFFETAHPKSGVPDFNIINADLTTCEVRCLLTTRSEAYAAACLRASSS
jgi:hypothetical protein